MLADYTDMPIGEQFHWFSHCWLYCSSLRRPVTLMRRIVDDMVRVRDTRGGTFHVNFKDLEARRPKLGYIEILPSNDRKGYAVYCSYSADVSYKKGLDIETVRCTVQDFEKGDTGEIVAVKHARTLPLSSLLTEHSIGDFVESVFNYTRRSPLDIHLLFGRDAKYEGFVFSRSFAIHHMYHRFGEEEFPFGLFYRGRYIAPVNCGQGTRWTVALSKSVSFLKELITEEFPHARITQIH